MNGESDTKPKQVPVHKTTFLVISLFVILPWLLIAIPRGSTDIVDLATPAQAADPFVLPMSTVAFKQHHGWPAIHLVSVRQPKAGDALSPAPDCVFDWAFDHRIGSGRDSFERSFWSEPTRWPFRFTQSTITNTSMVDFKRIVWAGLFINIAFVAFGCVAVGCFCERRIRQRGSIFKFTITELMLFVLLTCGLFAWIRQCNQATITASPEWTEVAKVLSTDYRLFDYQYRERFPRLVARLLDYAHELPFLDENELRPIDKLIVYLSDNHHAVKTNRVRERLVDVIDRYSVSKQLVCNWSDSVAEVVNKLDPQNIERLDVHLLRLDGFIKELPKHLTEITTVHIELAISPDDHLDLMSIDEMNGLKGVFVSLRFSDPKNHVHSEWQTEYIEHVMQMKNLEGAYFEHINPSAAKRLSTFYVGERKIAFKTNSELCVDDWATQHGTELIHELKKVGFSDNRRQTIDNWDHTRNIISVGPNGSFQYGVIDFESN